MRVGATGTCRSRERAGRGCELELLRRVSAAGVERWQRRAAWAEELATGHALRTQARLTRRAALDARRRVTFRAAVTEEDRAAMLRAVPAVPVAVVPDGRDAHTWDDSARALLRCYAAAVAVGAIEHPAPAMP